MFATLRYNQTTKIIEQPARPISQRACIHCHSRKLRCSSVEGGGCDRCASRNLKCKYPQPTKRKGPRLSKSSTSSASGVDTSPAASKRLASSSVLTAAATATKSWQSDTNHGDYNLLVSPETTASFLGHNSLSILPTPITLSTTVAATDQPDYGSMSLDLMDSFHFPKSTSTATLGIIQDTNFWLSNDTSTISPLQSISMTDMLYLNGAPETAPDLITPESCDCQTTALRLQENLCIVESQCSLRNMGRVLRTNKSVLVRCSSLLDCMLCSKQSHFMMLLTTICQRITSCFEKVLAILTRQYNRLHGQDNPQPFSAGDDDDETHQITVRGYDLDSDEEPCLFGALTLVQLRKLRIILDNIRDIALVQEWKPHMDIIEQNIKDNVHQISLYDKSKSPDTSIPNLQLT